MKTKTYFLFVIIFTYFHQIFGQSPVIGSFSRNGQLVCTNLVAGSVASVEWASSLSGPWQNNWAGLDTVTADSNGTIQVSVPMFYRVRQVTPPAGMVLIPAGTFTMGNSVLDPNMPDAPPTSVYVSAFFMDTNLVSYSQWLTVYTYAISHGYSFTNSGQGSGANDPVGRVNWYDCVKWCNARSEQAGLTPVYYAYSGLTQVYRTGETTNIFVNWTANGYRLPTEAEWEKAARGGLSGKRFPWGNTISKSQANYNGNTNNYNYDLGPNGSIGKISVGTFAPNDYGLYDMAGNIFQWCWNWYGTPYTGGTDPRGPISGTQRVLRGGSWLQQAYACRSANRWVNYPTGFDTSQNGFRCVQTALGQ